MWTLLASTSKTQNACSSRSIRAGQASALHSASGLDRGPEHRRRPTRRHRHLPTFSDMREYLRVGLGSGADSLIRNVAYFFMIVRIVNTIGSTEIGGYYVAIQILWSFMLVPVLAFADSAKALVANVSGDIERVKSLWRASMLVVTGMMVVWIALTPAFPSFAGALTDDEDTVRWAVTAFGILFVPYVLFSFNTVIDSIFYGIGKTKYLAYQAILTNGTVYLVAFLLYV